MGENVGRRFGEDDLAAQAAHSLGHFDADRAAAEYQQAPRHSFHAGHLAIGPQARELTQARDRRHDRIRACGHDDMSGGVPHPVHLHDAGPA